MRFDILFATQNSQNMYAFDTWALPYFTWPAHEVSYAALTC